MSQNLVSSLCAVRRTGPFSRTSAAGALRCASTAVRSVGEADFIYYFNRTSSNMARTCRGLEATACSLPLNTKSQAKASCLIPKMK